MSSLDGSGPNGSPRQRMGSEWAQSLVQASRMPSAAYYEIADLAIAKRIGALLFYAAAVTVVVLLPFAPPDQSAIGGAGWAVVAAVVALAVATGVRLSTKPSIVGTTEMMAMSYEALALIAGLVWLTGSHSPYLQLLLITQLYVAAVHPPRRTLVFSLAATLVLFSPVIEHGWSSQVAGESIGRLLVWNALVLSASGLTAMVRLRRAELEAEGASARAQARSDALTGLGNRRACDEALTAAIIRARRTNAALSVLVADIASFKRVNDRYGLDEGDRLLREVAAVLRDTVRSPDSCFRWGGDEFLILADVERSGAERLCARMADAVAIACVTADGSSVSIHTGFAQFGVDGEDPESLVRAAAIELARVKSEIPTQRV